MKKTSKVIIVLLLLAVFYFHSCQTEPKSSEGSWIKGSEQEMFEIIEKQFRGFDLAMMETGYRYQELYWAGQDGNWEYANYQLNKIDLCVKNGLQRRPKRAKSAEYFLKNTIPEMRKAVDSKDTAMFNQNFELMTISCNSCHIKEEVSFFNVNTPEYRNSPIKKTTSWN